MQRRFLPKSGVMEIQGGLSLDTENVQSEPGFQPLSGICQPGISIAFELAGMLNRQLLPMFSAPERQNSQVFATCMADSARLSGCGGVTGVISFQLWRFMPKNDLHDAIPSRLSFRRLGSLQMAPFVRCVISVGTLFPGMKVTWSNLDLLVWRQHLSSPA